MQDLSATEMLSNTTPIKCEKCQGEVFVEGMMLRKVSRIMLGDSKDGILPIPVFVCQKCGHINKEFLPKAISENQQENPKSNLIV